MAILDTEQCVQQRIVSDEVKKMLLSTMPLDCLTLKMSRRPGRDELKQRQ